MIIKALEVMCNCYIVGSEATKEGMVIDPGADAPRILKNIKELGLSVKLIVLTHNHYDHTGALKEVKNATGAPLAAHEADSGSHSRRGMFGLPQQALPAPDRLLKGGDTIHVGDLQFLVIHTPGHTPGGICLLGDGVAFTGDTLFNFGIGRMDLPGGDEEAMVNSLFTKLMVLPDDTKVYPGHGPSTTIGTERRGNPFLRTDLR